MESKLVELCKTPAQVVSPLQSRFWTAVSRYAFGYGVNFSVVLVENPIELILKALGKYFVRYGYFAHYTDLKLSFM